MIAVVSHDAGGAEVVSSYVRRERLDCLFVLEGPAIGIFRRKLGEVAPVPLAEAVAGATEVLCGSGWQSDLEVDAIRAARAAGKKSTAFLDHWVNYAERFVRNGEVSLPDELFVGDADGLRIARATFPGVPVTLVRNPYLLDLEDQLRERARLAPPAAPRSPTVLYVCEPISEHGVLRWGDARHWGYTEQDALQYFLTNLPVLGYPSVDVIIRPHPAEPADKYAWARDSAPSVSFGGKRPLLEEIADSDVVAGCNSMALVVALLAGKRAVSCIPPGGEPCSLPQAEIESLQALARDRELFHTS